MGNTPSAPKRDRDGRSITTHTAAIPTPAPSDVEACPVDHKTREAWLQQARKDKQEIPHPLPPSTSPIPAGESCDSTQMEQRPSAPPPPSAIQALLKAIPGGNPTLATEREVSTIPRALPQAQGTPSSTPANNEVESGPDKSGKWIYPSEKMFFEAMKRKNHDPKAEDMRSIVPIHNAVNERAWGEILAWEKGMGGDAYVPFSIHLNPVLSMQVQSTDNY
jgi:cytochrome c heme-lyase